MHVRLAFSVMSRSTPSPADRRGLAVGDAAFQQKCFDEFHRIRDEGKTSSSSRTTWAPSWVLRSRVAARARRGRRDRRARAMSRRATSSRTSTASARGRRRDREEPERAGDGPRRGDRGVGRGPPGERRHVVTHGEPFALRCACVSRDVIDPLFRRDRGTAPPIQVGGHHFRGAGRFEPGDEVVFMSVRRRSRARALRRHGARAHPAADRHIDRRERLVSFVVTATAGRRRHGRLAIRLSFERSTPIV